MLKYTGHQTLCDIAFGIFVITWFLARHVAYLSVCWSVYKDVPKEIVIGCMSSRDGQYFTSDGGSAILSNVLQSFMNEGGPVCYNENLRNSFLGLLLALQAITIMWFGMILRVLYKVLRGQAADDSRSDDEGENEDVDTDIKQDPTRLANSTEKAAGTNGYLVAPIEQTVGVEGLSYRQKRSSPRYRARKPGSYTSPLAIAGSSDRKELLGRIGCDQPI